MMNNERGGILSKLFVLPAAVALMVGFFFLGYYVGKYQKKTTTLAETVHRLPEVASKEIPKAAKFTFYKTLTEAGDKTVSIDLKPEASAGDASGESASQTPAKDVKQPEKEKRAKSAGGGGPARSQKQAAAKKPRVRSRKGPALASSANAKTRYSIQIASYQEKEMAEEDVKKMKKAGYAAFIVSSELPGKGMWHRVRVGSFSNKSAAERLQKELHAKEGFSPILVTE
jgi:cell division protein FtsN